MGGPDIRWIQRFEHFERALGHLRDAVNLAAQRPLSELEQQGSIKAFEYTHELAWNTLKDFLSGRGVLGLYGSKDAVRGAVRTGLIVDGELWLEMIQDRNSTIHGYDEAATARILQSVSSRYLSAFEALARELTSLRDSEEDPT